MKILNINSFYKFSIAKNTTHKLNNHCFLDNTNQGDVVSFTSKKYDADSIVNPTNHCAYCGCKVYNDQQIDSIAKEIVSSKADRLEGKLKSILEKLEGAKYSQELSLAKRLENQEQIKFFKNFLDISSKKSYLKGEAIFEQVYGLSKDQAIELLIKNMLPLKRTIDHVSPQNEEKDNNNSDVNLVEACYTCNHDLKKGVTFKEFYAMFPSIKSNMPFEKFQYAMNQVLDSSPENIMQRISASNMLKLIDRLFIQRTEAKSYLDSIDFRIKNSVDELKSVITSSEEELQDMLKEREKLEAEYSQLKQDAEFVSIMDRLSLTRNIDDLNTIIASLRDKKQKLSNEVNALKNNKQSGNNKKAEMSAEDKEEKINSLKRAILSINAQIKEKEDKILELESELDALNAKYPTVEMFQSKKSVAESVNNAFLNLADLNNSYNEKKLSFASLEQTIKDLTNQIATYPQGDFNTESYSSQDQAIFARYKDLKDAAAFINEHPNGNNTKTIINQFAIGQINQELAELENQPIVVQYNAILERKSLEQQLKKLNDQRNEMKNQLNNINKQIKSLQNIVDGKSREDAVLEISACSESIRKVTAKNNNMKIPQRISTLDAEITLIKQTISDLNRKLQDIETAYTSDT